MSHKGLLDINASTDTLDDKANNCLGWFMQQEPDTDVDTQRLLLAWFRQALTGAEEAAA